MRRTITRIGATGAGALLAIGMFAAPPAGATGSGKHGKDRNGGHSASASCFTPSGHTQGKSHSDPDGMSNGGADKPGCTGGFDADRDGNNGCGNDADREDDNNGRCGGTKTPKGDDHGATKPPRSDDQGATKADAVKKTRCQDHAATKTKTTKTAVAGSADDCSCTKGSEPAAAVKSEVAGVKLVAAAVPAAAAPLVEPTTTTTATAAPADTSPAVTDQPVVDAAAAASTPGTEVLGETLSRPSALARTGAGLGGMALLGVLLCSGGRLTVLARRLLRIG